MNVRSIGLVLLLFIAIPAAAGTISSITPQSFPAGDDGQFLNILGSELSGLVVFSGPAGRFEVEAHDVSPDYYGVFVPMEVVKTAGVYSVSVGDSNAVRLDVTQPSLQILGHDPIVVEATSREGAVVEFDVPTYGGRDPNPVVTCNPKSGSLFPLGGTTVRCVATNTFGERAEGDLYVFVQDAAGPVLTMPDRIVVDAEDDTGAVVTYEATAHDAIDGDVPVDCQPPSGSRFPVGVTTVECTANDSSLNPAHGTFEVEVRGDDHGTLTIVVPDDIVAEAISSAGAEVRFTVMASGSDDPNPTITCDPPSGATFPLGPTTVRCIATDSFGDRAEGEFEIMVVDTTPPALNLSDITAEASGGSAQVTYAPTATDLVDGAVEVTCEPPSGTHTFPIGDTTVPCSAADSRGNTANGSFVVSVVDTTPPQITSLAATPDVLAPPNHKLAGVTLTVEAVDANDPAPQCSATNVTANQPLDGPAAPEPDWILDGPLALQLRSERDGGSDRVYSVHVRCSDLFGNSATATVDVTVPHGNAENTAPVTVAPSTSKKRSVRKP